LPGSFEAAISAINRLSWATDESHIIRCIEYWDVERRRYPHYEHCAVLVAEDITSRFLNVLALLNGQIPLIIIQLTALKVGNQIVLNFVRIMDKFSLRRDEEAETVSQAVVDREYWIKRSSSALLKVAEDCLQIVNQGADPQLSLAYNKGFIGLNDGVRARNFIHFRPRRQFVHVLVDVEDRDLWVKRFEDQELDAVKEGGRFLRVTLKPVDFENNISLVTELLRKAVDEYGR
jgi:hypothetical protein